MRLLFCAIIAAIMASMVASGSAKTGVATIVSSVRYNKILPKHIAFYSYDAFVLGGTATAGFCTTGDKPIRIRECAAFLANVAHETGGGRLIAESGRNRCPDYCDATQTNACAPTPGQSYYGRGWLQLSWNYNYCDASKYIFGDDGSTLVQNPGILEQNAAVSLQASLWYWMTQSGVGTMPAHDCITSGSGFGCTIRSINGVLECDGGNPAQVKSRIDNYLYFLAILSDGRVKPVGPNGC